MSAARRCRSCGSKNVTILSKEGKIVCMDCAEVIGTNELAAEVGFNENSAGAVSLSGTMIGGHSTGLTMSKNGAMFQRGDSRDLTISKGQNAVRDLARKIPSFPHRVTTRACRYFETAVNHGFTKGRTRDHVAAACLFMSCRTPDRGEGGHDEKPAPFMLMDFSTVLKISVFELGMIYLKLVNKFKFGGRICLQDPSLYIDRWARMLEFDPMDVNKVAEDACHLVMGFQRDWLSEGRRPSGICGAALLLAARMNNYHRTMHEIIQVVKVADVTIKKRLAEFKDTASSDLTIEEFRRAWTQGPDYWDSMAQSLPPAKIKNDAMEAAQRGLKRKRKWKKEGGSDGSGSDLVDDEEEEDDEDSSSDEGSDPDEKDESIEPGMKALSAASKKLRAALRKRELAKIRRSREETLKHERLSPSPSRADSIVPGSSPHAGSERAKTPVPMPNWKMESVEPAYMAKAREAAANPRRRRRSSGKGKRPVVTADGADEGGTDKEEGGAADTDKEEGDQTGPDEKSDGAEGLERMDMEMEEGDAEDVAEEDLLEQHGDLVDKTIEKELADALNADVAMDASGQTKVTTMSSEIKELAGKQKQRAAHAAVSAKRDWADGLDEEELEAYIMDEAGFEAKKRIWWHNNYEYMIKRYERKQKEDGLTRPQQPGQRKRQRPGPAASALEATMNMVRGKNFSRSVNYDAIRRLHEEDNFSDTEEPDLKSIGPRATSQKPDVADSEKEVGTRGAGTDKEEGTAAGTDKEEGDDGKGDDDKGDEEEGGQEEYWDDGGEEDITQYGAMEDEGFEEYS